MPPHGWLPNVRVNDDTGRAAQVEVSLAAGTAGLILASWVDSRNGTRCAFSVSTDGGTTWGKNITVAPTGSGITGDAVAGIDASGKLYAVCQDYGVSQILLSTSSDRGSTWSGWRPIQASPDKPWVAGVRNGTIFLSWLGSPGGFKRSLDGGATWSAVTSLGTLSHGTAISPVDDGVVHVPYNQGAQVRYLRSKDFGATFDPGRNLADMGTACFGCTPRHHPIIGSGVSPNGRVVAITWASTAPGGDGNDDVWVVISQDGGDSWSKAMRVNDNSTPSRQFQPWTAVDAQGRVHVIWTDFRNGGQNATYYARAENPYTEFSKNIEITDQRGAPPSFMGDYKGLAIVGNDMFAAWCDSRNGNGDVYFSRASVDMLIEARTTQPFIAQIAGNHRVMKLPATETSMGPPEGWETPRPPSRPQHRRRPTPPAPQADRNQGTK
ncbi:MAG TPA: sialidase family protein [Polyangiaceae bacterium]|nr:sialidase family protein [Polyangiaceae bacterium]